ncbi:MAG: NAD-dependent epimerase/dehydratase family protein [Candidatus Binatia bacterium]
MKALITGVAGFIGSSICDALVAAGHEVIGLDCFADYYPRDLKERNLSGLVGNPSFRFVEADLVDVDLVDILEGVECVFHQAAQAGVRSSWGEYFRVYSDNNVYATQRLLEAAKDMVGLRKFVYASSSSVYGDTADLPMRETSATNPVSPYGVTKLAGEHLVNLYNRNYGLPTVALRYFTVYGPRQRPDMAFNRFIRSTVAKKSISLYGDGRQSRDFTFIDDIVAANLSAAASEVSGEVLNIGGGSRTTVNEVLEQIGGIIGRRPEVQRLGPQQGDVTHTAADTSRARKLIGYEPRVGLAEDLRREVEWLTGLSEELTAELD